MGTRYDDCYRCGVEYYTVRGEIAQQPKPTAMHFQRVVVSGKSIVLQREDFHKWMLNDRVHAKCTTCGQSCFIGRDTTISIQRKSKRVAEHDSLRDC